MVQPIPPQQPEPIRPYSSPAERKKMFELQWEISVIGIYLAATQTNGHLQNLQSKLKNGMRNGIDMDSLAKGVQYLVDQLNKSDPLNPLPPFVFSTGAKHKAAENYFQTIDKLVNSFSEMQLFDIPGARAVHRTRQDVIEVLSTKGDATSKFAKLDEWIEEINRHLPLALRLPSIPQTFLGG